MSSTEQVHRTLQMSYSVLDGTKFAVTFDPPYESLDGGCDYRVCECTRDEIRETVTDLILANIERLAPDQGPMLIEIRREA